MNRPYQFERITLEGVEPVAVGLSLPAYVLLLVLCDLAHASNPVVLPSSLTVLSVEDSGDQYPVPALLGELEAAQLVTVCWVSGYAMVQLLVRPGALVSPVEEPCAHWSELN